MYVERNNHWLFLSTFIGCFSLHLLVVSLYILWLFISTFIGYFSLHLLVVSLYIYWLFLSTFICFFSLHTLVVSRREKQPMYVQGNNQ
jgi:hypothetical protein